MNVWLLKISEPWIVPGEKKRLYRAGMLAEALAARGHRVTWFNSIFDHVMKRNLDFALVDDELKCTDNISIHGLRGCTYTRSRSLRRLLHHRQTAQEFRKLAAKRQPPDIIYSSWPTVELAWEGVCFAQTQGIPVVIDIRDLWPEAITDVVPSRLRPLVRLVLQRHYALAKRTLRASTAIIGITDGMLQWALDFAGRKESGLDKVFPLGYMGSPVISKNLTAEAYWTDQGVRGEPDEFVACYAGLFPKRTDLLTVVAAARILHEKGEKGVKFVLCGTGDLEPELRQKAAGLDNVILPGWVEHQVLKTLMARCSVALFPYPRDVTWIRNLPNKFFEYVAEGLPIVSCLEGEVQRQIEQNACGVMYRAHDPQDLARVICSVRNDIPWRRTMAANAKVLSSKYDAAIVYNDLVLHLEKIATRTCAT